MEIELVIKGKDCSGIVYKIMSLVHLVFAVYFGFLAYSMRTGDYTFNPKTSFVIALIIAVLMIEKANDYFVKKNKKHSKDEISN